ncbi:MAG: DUF5050 domain-containing protein [Bacilli bacterium]
MKKLLLLGSFIFMLSISSCGGAASTSIYSNTVPTISTTSSTDSSTTSTSSDLRNFDTVTFVSKSVTYDGLPHTLVAGDIPEGTNVVYTNNGPFSEIGTYPMSVTCTKTGYNPKTLEATLTITEKVFEGITFSSALFIYDGKPHKIEVEGTLPNGTTVTYKCSNDETIKNEATEAGTYQIEATLVAANYKEETRRAVLTIIGTGNNRSMYFEPTSKVLYFQNGLDNNKLYSYTEASTSKKVSKVNNDEAHFITKYGEGIAYLSKATLVSSLKAINPSNNSSDTLEVTPAEYLVEGNGTDLFYIVNNLDRATSGIYRFNNTGSSLLLAGSYKNLMYRNEVLYFIDTTFSLTKMNRLYSFSLTNNQKQVVIDEYVTSFSLANDSIYYATYVFPSTNTLNSLNLTTLRKVTLANENATNLTFLSDKLYYLKLEPGLPTSIIGNGIYYVDTRIPNPSLTGTLIDIGKEVCSIYGAGNKIYYYEVSSYNLMSYNTNNKSITNLLNSYKEEPELNTNVNNMSLTYGTLIYYISSYEDGALYSFDTVTKLNLKLTSLKVTYFTISNTSLYAALEVSHNNISIVSFEVTSPAAGKVLLSNLGAVSSITKNNNNIFYLSSAGEESAIYKAELDGSKPTLLYKQNCSELSVIDNKLYFIEHSSFNNHIKTLNIASGVSELPVDLNIEATTYKIVNNKIFYITSAGYNLSKIMSVDLDGSSNKLQITVPTLGMGDELVIANDVIYYLSAVAGNNKSIYKVNINGGVIMAITDAPFNPKGMTVLDNFIYFTNAIAADYHFYSSNVHTKETVLIA